MMRINAAPSQFLCYVVAEQKPHESTLLPREYDAVLEGLERARRLYADAGPEGSQGLRRTRDPTGLVKAAAMRDGQRLKGEAVSALRSEKDRARPALVYIYIYKGVPC